MESKFYSIREIVIVDYIIDSAIEVKKKKKKIIFFVFIGVVWKYNLLYWDDCYWIILFIEWMRLIEIYFFVVFICVVVD